MNILKSGNTSDKMNYNNNALTDSSSIANSFSDYFYNIYSSRPMTSTYPNHCCNQSFFLFPIAAGEVCSVVLVLKNIRAGLDNISAFHLKLVAPLISETLYIITNHVLKCGIFPISPRRANIVS